MANTAVSSTNVAVVDYIDVGKFAGYSRYNSGTRTRPWVTPILTGKSSVYSISIFTRKCPL
jgi:hypothetical protein